MCLVPATSTFESGVSLRPCILTFTLDHDLGVTRYIYHPACASN